MVKHQKRTIGAIMILLMLGASPLSVTYSFADIEDSQGTMEENVPNTPKNTQKNGLGAILTEKVVDGKLEVRHYALPDDASEEDMQRILSLDQTSGWAYVNYKTYHSGIILFDGKASKIGEDAWEISTNGVLKLGEKQLNLELSGKTSESCTVMHGTASSEDLSYKVIFSGKIAETDEENVFVISLMKSSFKNPDDGQNIKLLQIGELATNSENSIGNNQEFRNSIR